MLFFNLSKLSSAYRFGVLVAVFLLGVQPFLFGDAKRGRRGENEL